MRRKLPGAVSHSKAAALETQCLAPLTLLQPRRSLDTPDRLLPQGLPTAVTTAWDTSLIQTHRLQVLLTCYVLHEAFPANHFKIATTEAPGPNGLACQRSHAIYFDSYQYS